MPFSPARQSRSLTAGNKKQHRPRGSGSGVPGKDLTLVIQSNVTGRLYVWILRKDGRVLAQAKKSIIWYGSENLLPFIDATVQRTKIQLTKISSIFVVRGPGPFTAVRTGLIVANTLGMVLNIPVRGIVSVEALGLKDIREVLRSSQTSKKAAVVKPWYGKEPNISTPSPSATARPLLN